MWYGKVSLRLSQVHHTAGTEPRRRGRPSAFMGMVILIPLSLLLLQPVLPGWTIGKRGHLTVHLPYVAEVSERIRRVCKDFNTRAVFKSRPILHSLLTKVKDPLLTANDVYKRPCTFREVYVGETKHQLETHLKEHKEAYVKGFRDKSAIAKHAWTEDHPICWDDTRILPLCSSACGHMPVTPIEDSQYGYVIVRLHKI